MDSHLPLLWRPEISSRLGSCFARLLPHATLLPPLGVLTHGDLWTDHLGCFAFFFFHLLLPPCLPQYTHTRTHRHHRRRQTRHRKPPPLAHPPTHTNTNTPTIPHLQVLPKPGCACDARLLALHRGLHSFMVVEHR